jgi:hypothetical protein
MESQMARISVRVRSGTATFRVDIQALSVSEALALAGSRHPHGEVRVVFPAELRGYLDGKPAAPAGATERTHALAA